MSAATHVAWREVFGGAHGVAASVVLLAILVPAVNVFITATVLPSVVQDIGGLALYAWATMAYSVASILGSASSSAVARRLGLRTGLITAAAIFVAGSALCGLAPAMLVLVAGRGVQGIGGGMINGVVHALIREVFPARLWPRMFATMSAAWGIAALMGPLVGGLFAQHGHWRWAFLSMVPVVTVTAALAARLLPARRRRPATDAPFPSGRLLMLCAAALCLASVGNVEGLAARVALVAGAASLIAVALRLDARARGRLFPSGMLSVRRPIGQGFWVIFLLGLSTTPFGVFGPLLFQVLHGFSPVGAGYVFAGHSFAWTGASIVSSRLAAGHARAATFAGPLLMTLGLVGLFVVMGPGPITAIAAAILIEGAGIGTCWPHIGSVMLGSARPDEEEATAALVPNAQLFGVAFGVALCAIIAGASGLTRDASAPVVADASRALFGTFAFTAAAATVIAAGLARGPRAGAAPPVRPPARA
jgi:MFS family permease